MMAQSYKHDFSRKFEIVTFFEYRSFGNDILLIAEATRMLPKHKADCLRPLDLCVFLSI